MPHISSEIVAKKRSAPLQPEEGVSEPKKTTMKVAPDLLRKARMVSLDKGVDLYDYIDTLLRAVVEADYRAMIDREASPTPDSPRRRV
jgi:hypothetical protein